MHSLNQHVIDTLCAKTLSRSQRYTRKQNSLKRPSLWSFQLTEELETEHTSVKMYCGEDRMEREETLATDRAQISLRSYGRSDSWSPKVLKKERREP